MTPSGGELLDGEEPGEFFFLPAAWSNTTSPEKQQAAFEAQFASTRGAVVASQDVLFRVLTLSPPQVTRNAAQRIVEWSRIMEDLKEAAAYGDAVAMAALSHAYARGFGGSVDRRQAFNWAWQAAVEAEHPAGFYALALAMREGIGTEKNPVAAEGLIERAAKAGDAPAITDRGSSYVHLLRDAAEAGYPPAMHVLGQLALEPMMSGRSLGTIFRGPDRKEALQLVEAAAEAGYAPAMMTLYRWSLKTYPGQRDAGDYLRKAADQGDLEAQLLMARALRGTPRRAQLTGVYKPHPSAPIMLSEATAPLRVPGLETDPAAAFMWAKIASERDLPEAFVLLAELSDPDAALMVEFLHQAAKLGYTEALALEAAWRFHGILPKDPKLSFDLATEAAQKDVSLAYWTLGHCYATGTGAGRDNVTALHYFIQALKAGWPEARPHLQDLAEKNVDLGRRTAKPEWTLAMQSLLKRYRESAIELEVQIPGSTAGVVTIERVP
jgi:TPR repeat protein